jgi:predicted ATP-binding protein involved in virulence
LTFNENEIGVLTAVNGRGKTTILSHIVDAWHEMARPYFQYLTIHTNLSHTSVGQWPVCLT